MPIDSEFLSRLFQYCEGSIEIRPLPGGQQGFFDLEDLAGIEAHCERFKSKNLFFGVATRAGGGTKAHVVRVPAVWADVDFKDTPREILADKLKSFPFKPSIIVKSGGGAHLYWLLKVPVGQGDIEDLEEVNRRIAGALGGDRNAVDAARVLRLPGTLNLKYEPARRCEVTQTSDFSYSLEDFLEMLPPAPERQAADKVEARNDTGWLQELMDGVEAGGRNAAGAKIAGYWINKLPAADVLTILQAWNARNAPPLEEPELRKIAESVSRYQPETGTRGGIDIANVYDAGRMVEAYREHIANLQKNRFILGIGEIDKRLRGIAGGEVLTILARSGAFKTAMLQNMLKGYVQNSAWAAVFFSLEMPVSSVAERYFQILDGCTGQEVETMFRDPGQRSVCEAATAQFTRDLLRLYTVPVRVDLKDIAGYVQLIEAEKGVKVGVIGIDYLGLMEGPGANSYELVSKLSRGVKGMAKMLKIPAVLLAQVSRKAGRGETPISLDMGRDSGAIEESADFVLGLWQCTRDKDAWSDPSEEPGRDLICRILKNRKGPIGSTWKLELVPHAMVIGQGAEPFEPPKTKNGVDL